MAMYDSLNETEESPCELSKRQKEDNQQKLDDWRAMIAKNETNAAGRFRERHKTILFLLEDAFNMENIDEARMKNVQDKLRTQLDTEYDENYNVYILNSVPNTSVMGYFSTRIFIKIFRKISEKYFRNRNTRFKAPNCE